MARNDAILIDGLVVQKMIGTGLDKGQAFERLVFEQLLKSFDLSPEEIDSGWVDGKDDGGVDGFFTFLNGNLITAPDVARWPRKNASIDLWIISCKHADTFRQEVLNTLFPTVEELLDFKKSDADFQGRYSRALLDARDIAATVYEETAANLPTITVTFAIATRGDTSELGENVSARGQQMCRLVEEYFSGASAVVRYFGAGELIAMQRKGSLQLELRYEESLSSNQDGAYVLLVSLDAYAQFVSDDCGNLRRDLFDSNVRDFLGQNRVNKDIAETLLRTDSPDFWWLNNGVTILATEASGINRRGAGKALKLSDVQIVNGLQTTETIHAYFRADSPQNNSRSLLVKVIVSEDERLRDSIIQATNNQTSVMAYELIATDKTQRDIEDVLESEGWFYERRRNYYKNVGKPHERLVTPLFAAAAAVAIYRKAPDVAGRLESRMLVEPEVYGAVFDQKIPLDVWPAMIAFLKSVEMHISPLIRKSRRADSQKIVYWRAAVALCALAKVNRTFSLNRMMFLETPIDLFTADFVTEVFYDLRDGLGGARTSEAITPARIRELCLAFGNKHAISDTQSICRWRMPIKSVDPVRERAAGLLPKVMRAPKIVVDPETLDLIANAIPVQPWPTGMQKRIVESLNISPKIVATAVLKLIEEGRFLNQYDGVVVDHDGIIVALDPEKADSRYLIGDAYSHRSR